MLLIISALFIISNENLSPLNSGDAQKFGSFYLSWLDGVFSNIRTLTGYATEMNWMPE